MSEVADQRAFVHLEGGTWWGHPDLVAHLVPVGEVREDPGNLRQHSDFNLRSTAASLREYGQQHELVARPDGTLLIGSGRLRSVTDPAYELNWTHVAVRVFRGTEEQARKLAMLDNRTGELGAWDYEALGIQLAAWRAEGEDMMDLGWRDHEVAALADAEWTPDDVGEMPDADSVGRSIKVNHDQREVFDRAWRLLRELEGDDQLEEGETAMRLSRDFLDRNTRQ